VGMLNHQLDQSPDLYADIAVHNPATDDVAGRLLKATQEICELYGSEDRSNLIRVMNEVASYMAPATPGAP